MMYQSAVEQAIAEQKNNPTTVVIVKLATVTGLSGGKAQIQFYGDNAQSSKLYPYIDGYMPNIGDTVALLPQGDTYIILGKVSTEPPEQKWAAANHNHDGTYIPVADADKLVSGNVTATLSAAALTPSGNKTVNLGSSGNQWKNLYTEKIYINGTEFVPLTSVSQLEATLNSTHYAVQLQSNSGHILLQPSANEVISLGTASRKMKNVIAKALEGAWHYSAENTTTRYLQWSGQNVVTPNVTNVISLGTATLEFLNIYGKNIYSNGTAVTSDRRKKKSIRDLGKKYIDFFKRLRPVSFKYKDGSSGRTHTGFIAQEVETAANESGITTEDCGIVVIQENGEYALRYDELIAIQTAMIQNLQTRVEALECEALLMKGDVK